MKKREDASREGSKRDNERTTAVDMAVATAYLAWGERGCCETSGRTGGMVFATGRSPSRARKLSAKLRLYRRSQREGTPSTRENLSDIW